MGKLNILVLHRLGPVNRAPLFLQRHVFSLRTYFPEHNYIYHDAHLPVPEYIRDARFDAIILDVTFLCVRWAGDALYNKIRCDFDFVKDSDAVKIAFPQDEYDCHRILDDWMCDWKVDVLYSVISSNWNLLYPRFHQLGEIRLGYTGYIDDELLKITAKPFASRTVDVGYRARKLPPYFGRIGEVKWTIGEAFSHQAEGFSLKTDIVLGDKGTLLGQSWLDFINDCKFTLGANSGSSLLDPYGKIQRKVREYIVDNPQADFAEVEEYCFKGADNVHAFTAISPRVFEAGLLESCQILVEGDYSHVIRPWEHYIPIASDASDFAVVHEAMQDQVLVDRLRRDCREALLDFDGLRAKEAARKVLEVVEAWVTKKHVVSDVDLIDKFIVKYDEEMVPAYLVYWKRQDLKRRFSSALKKAPLIDSWVRAVRAKLA
jgi:hypothetical protein